MSFYKSKVKKNEKKLGFHIYKNKPKQVG